MKSPIHLASCLPARGHRLRAFASVGRAVGRCRWAMVWLALLAVALPVRAADAVSQAGLLAQHQQLVAPFLQTYCLDCHGTEDPEAKLDLTTGVAPRELTSHYQLWEIVAERVAAGEMPPADSSPQPTDEQRVAVVEWIAQLRGYLAAQNAGDPGPVPARRLSNAEYNYSIRDLTGVDIQPTATFPVDPANEAGFDNSAESLTISPALLDKYLGAARQVTDHLVLTPTGIAFAPHPVVTETDRDKYCVNRIVEFYGRQPTDIADYFFACWQLRNRSAKEETAPAADLAAAAREHNVSRKYLTTVWEALTRPRLTGPLATLQETWRSLPPDDILAARQGCQAMRDMVIDWRTQLRPEFPFLQGGGVAKGSQAVVLWRNRQVAAHRQRYSEASLAAAQARAADQTDALSRALIAPQDLQLREQFINELAEFCRIFPDAFYVSERGREYVEQRDKSVERGRLLSAGFHSMMGYFRDDLPLCDLVLSDRECQELDALWRELDFVTNAPWRQYAGYLWFERAESKFLRDPEFDGFRAEDRAAGSADMIDSLSALYLAKVRRLEGSEVIVSAVTEYFEGIDQQLRWVEAARLAAQPRHIAAVLEFAERAFRRPLSDSEALEWRQYYHRLREQEQLDHESAIQDLMVSVLMSPHFCFRLDLGSSATEARPLTNFELASRLSYFLWSSMPDETLLQAAAEGRLTSSEELLRQSQRLRRSPKVRALATEFTGNWLDFRRFQQHNSVDRDHYPQFTDSLRQAMFEEPVRFVEDMIRSDRSILDVIDGEHTFANAELASHYGLELELADPQTWQRIDNAHRVGRGGLLPMSVFLTTNSPGLRTSPVKRGYWGCAAVVGRAHTTTPAGRSRTAGGRKTVGRAHPARDIGRSPCPPQLCRLPRSLRFAGTGI